MAALFAKGEHVDQLLAIAREIRRKERDQAEAIKNGRSLREQLHFARYPHDRGPIPSSRFVNMYENRWRDRRQSTLTVTPPLPENYEPLAAGKP